jgi:ABC-type nickel/cobalt efflux system permease component RcnA
MNTAAEESRKRSDTNDNGHEREVTDPVTHQPVLIHDVSKLELEQLPPPPTAKDEKIALKTDDGRSSYRRHQHMDQLVHELTHGNWWEDPLGDQRRTRVQTALLAGAAAGSGLLLLLMLYSTFNDWVGRGGSKWGVIDALCLIVGCVLLALGVTAAAVSFRLVQEDAKAIPRFRDDEVRSQPGRPTIQADHTVDSARTYDACSNQMALGTSLKLLHGSTHFSSLSGL